MSGLWIVVEGIDYSGKTTAISILQDILKEKTDKEVVVIKGIGSGIISSFMREQIMKEAFDDVTVPMAFGLGHYDSHREVIKHLKAGKIVISDRYVGSFYAQTLSFYKNKISRVIFEDLLQSEEFLSRPPDIEFLIDINTDTLNERRKLRLANETNWIDEKPIEYFVSSSSAYRQYLCVYSRAVIPKIIENNNTLELLTQDLKRHLTDGLDILGFSL